MIVTFSDFLVQLMNKTGWSKAELARRADVSHVSIGNYLRGRTPKYAEATKLAAAFGLKPDQLLNPTAEILRAAMSQPIAQAESSPGMISAGARGRLRAAREAAGLTQAQLAKQVGYSVAVYQDIEEGTSRMGRKQAEKVASVLGLDVTDLIGGSDEVTSQSIPYGTFGEIPEIELPKGMRAKFVPLLSMAQCGAMMAYEDSAYTGEGFLALNNKDPKAFAVTLAGSSMLPDFAPGDVAIVNPTRTPKQGGLVIAKLKGKNGDHDGGDVMLKRYHRHGSKVVLTSVNAENFPPMTFDVTDFVWLYHVPQVVKNFD